MGSEMCIRDRGMDDLPPEIKIPVLVDGRKIGAPMATKGNLEDAELELIRATLKTDQGNLTLVAKHLGIAKSTLYIKLKKYGLDQVLNGVREDKSERGLATTHLEGR